MKKILVTISLFVAVNVFAEPLFINIFALTDKTTDSQIEQINQTMSKSNVYSHYDVEPFNKNHPVHLTMYLTQYSESQVLNLERAMSGIAHQTERFNINTAGVSLKASNFLMLNVENTPRLQSLSDKVVAKASAYRDVNSVIPAWANSYPLKVQMFREYGSPNVYEGFDPHFSIFAAKIKPSEQEQFEKNVNFALNQSKFKSESVKVTGLGIGIANDDGQIIKIIKVYSFKK